MIRAFVSALIAVLGLSVVGLTPASAAFVVRVDTDPGVTGAQPSPNFGLGTGMTVFSTSTATSAAVGLGLGSSIFGGDAVLPDLDTYVFSYNPAVDGDNTAIAAGTALNAGGSLATGATAGATGDYNIYATWPFSTNVSGGSTTFRLSDGTTDLFSVSLDQNSTGNEWIFLGSAALNASAQYQLFQVAGANTFTSMRASGVMFDAVAIPEPGTFVALGAVALGFGFRRRLRRS